jgi:hypothetical protein
MLSSVDKNVELLAEGVTVTELLPYRLIPRGSTALLDAIGRSISRVRASLEALDSADRPRHIVVTVITDGLANASKEWTHLQVMDCVKVRMSEGWTFTFLGAGQDAIREGGRMGVAVGSSMTYAATVMGAREVVRAASAAMGRVRRGETSGLEFTEDGAGGPPDNYLLLDRRTT